MQLGSVFRHPDTAFAHADTFYSNMRQRAVTSHLPHEDLSPADEHRGTGDAEPMLQSLQVELVHLLIAALHLDWVEGEHGQPLHVLWGRQMGGGGFDDQIQGGTSIIQKT